MVAAGFPCRMTKVWMLATDVPRGMLGAGWNTPFYWFAADREVGSAQLVVGFALEDALDSRRHRRRSTSAAGLRPGCRGP